MGSMISTDQDIDRLLSLRVSSQIPLPPEIALCNPREAKEFHDWDAFYTMFGLDQHPLVQFLRQKWVDRMVSVAVSRSDQLDRMSHYAAWLGNEPVRIESFLPTQDDPRGGES